MSLKERLQALGQRLGLLQASTDQSATAPKIVTRVVKLEELLAGIRVQDIRMSSETRVDLPIGYDGIMEAAGVRTPAHGWTVQRLIEALRAADVNKLTKDEAQRRVLSVLAKDRASSEDVVRDAVARDQALDAFERFAREKLATRNKQSQARVAAAEAQIQGLQRELDRLRREQKQEEQEWENWRKNKVSYEKDMAWALSFLMENPLITIDEEKDAAERKG